MITVEKTNFVVESENDQELTEKISNAFLKMSDKLKDELEKCAVLQARSVKTAALYF